MFDLENQQQWNEVLKDSHILIANFFLPDDVKSSRITNELQEFANDLSHYPDTVFVRVDTRKYPSLAEAYNVKETPAIMVFHKELPLRLMDVEPNGVPRKSDKIVGNKPDLPQYLSDLIAQLHRPKFV